MRLVYTLPDFWPHVRRGSERIVRDLAFEMTRRGHEVTLYTRDPRGRGYNSSEFGFDVKYRGGSGVLEKALRLDPLEGFAVTAAAAVLLQDADVYHAFYLVDAYGLSLGTRLRHRPFVFSWHGLPNAEWWRVNAPRTHDWYLRMLPRAAQVTVMAPPSAERMRRDHGYRAMVVPPGIFTADYALPRRPDPLPTIVYAAALDEPRKRHELAIDAFALLTAGGVDARLLLVGQGSTDRIAAHLSRQEVGVRNRVELAPVTADLAPVYARCSLGLLTSHEEAFGMVVAEYLASGMPAVLSDDGGGVGIISEGTGLTYAAGSAQECARALRQGLELAADARTEQRCRARALDYDWAVRGSAFEAMYREVVG